MQCRKEPESPAPWRLGAFALGFLPSVQGGDIPEFPVETMTNHLQEAETLYNAGAYAEAGALFHDLWDQGHVHAGIRYAACLRKAGHAVQALAVSRRIARQVPDDPRARAELAWALFETQVEPAQAAHDLRRLEAIAAEALRDGQGAAVAEIVLAVVAEAMQQSGWDTANAWCDRLTPAELDVTPVFEEGQRRPSVRERWYSAKIRSLLRLHRWHLARKIALEALSLRPDSVEFARLAAKALAGQGELLQAQTDLRTLHSRRPSDWSTLYELAKVDFQLGHGRAAAYHAARAALIPGDERYRVELFALLAEILADQGQFEAAACHVVLARAWYTRQQQSPPGRLKKIEGRLRAALALSNQRFPDVTPSGLPGIRQRCQQEWQTMAASPPMGQ